MEHLCDASHLCQPEVVLGAKEELASGHTADVVVKLELGREGGALVGGVSTAYDIQGAVVSWISGYINILEGEIMEIKFHIMWREEREREEREERITCKNAMKLTTPHPNFPRSGLTNKNSVSLTTIKCWVLLLNAKKQKQKRSSQKRFDRQLKRKLPLTSLRQTPDRRGDYSYLTEKILI